MTRIEPLSPPYTPEQEARIGSYVRRDAKVAPLAIFRTFARHPALQDAIKSLGDSLVNMKVMEILSLTKYLKEAYGLEAAAAAGPVMAMPTGPLRPLDATIDDPSRDANRPLP